MKSKVFFVLFFLPLMLWGQGVVSFKIQNLGSTVEGTFERVTLDIRWKSDNPLASTVSGKVFVESINTGISLRDRHLRSSSYFHVSKFPEMTFTSTKIEKSAVQGSYLVTGLLTIKNKTREHTFNVTTGADGRRTYTTTLNRRDFNVGGWSMTMGDEVTVTVVE